MWRRGICVKYVLSYYLFFQQWKFSVSGGLDLPLLLWPLTRNTSISEVRKGTPQIPQCIQYSETHNFLQRQTPFLSPDHPYIDLIVEQESFDILALTLAFKPQGNAVGTLFHYKCHANEDEIIEFRLTFSHDGSKTIMTATRNIGGSITQRNFSPMITIYDSQWHFLIFTIREEYVSFNIYLNALYFSDSYTALDQRLETPGMLRLGADLETGNNPFRGSVTCLGLFEDIMTFTKKFQILNLCIDQDIWNDIPSEPFPEFCSTTTLTPEDQTTEITHSTGGSTNLQTTFEIPEGTTSATPETFTTASQEENITYTGYFKRDLSGKSPTQAPTSLFVVRSKHHCASHCISSTYVCQSFSVTKTDDSEHCRLYAQIHDVGLSYVPNVKYYRRRLIT